MELNGKFTQSDGVVSRELDGEVVLLSLASGTYFGLNAVGVQIWSFLAGHSRSIAEIRDLLVAEFDVNEERAQQDVIALASDLLEHDLIRQEN